MRWFQISANPNDQAVYKQRRSKLEGARSTKLIDDRIRNFCTLAKGLNVLDVGVVGHFAEARDNSKWLHGNLQKVAESITGVDILDQQIESLNQKGFNVKKLDITADTLNEKFDIIIVGDVIEHVQCPGRLVENCSKMLGTNGVLAISTPNPWYLNVLLKSIFGRQPFTDSADHVAWFDPSTMRELGERANLELYLYSGVAVTTAKSIRSRAVFAIRPILNLLGFNSLVFAKTIVYQFRRAP